MKKKKHIKKLKKELAEANLLNNKLVEDLRMLAFGSPLEKSFVIKSLEIERDFIMALSSGVIKLDGNYDI